MTSGLTAPHTYSSLSEYKEIIHIVIISEKFDCGVIFFRYTVGLLLSFLNVLCKVRILQFFPARFFGLFTVGQQQLTRLQSCTLSLQS